MCHSRDFRAFDQRKEKKPEDIRAAEDRRTETVNTMMNDANRHAEQANPERAPAKDPAPAK